MKYKLVKLPPPKEIVKLESLEKFAAIPKELKKSGIAFPKEFKAAVIMDKKNTPKYFVFDTYSLWDLLCAFDTKYEEGVTAKEYVYHNPVGWLIDAIETKLPINSKLVIRLKKGIKEAEKLGLVPFKQIEKELLAS